MMEALEPEYETTTKKGRPKIISEGYAYVRDKVGRDGEVVYWKCERKDELHCKGRVKTQE